MMIRTILQWTASGTPWQQGRHVLPHSMGWVPWLAILLMVYVNNNVVTAEPSPQGPESTFVLQFDGTDDRVTVPYDASFPTEVFTASAWIKLPQPAGRAAIIARGEDDNSFNLSWQLYVTRDGTLETMLEDANENNYCYPLNNCAPLGMCTIVGDLFVADDTWHHVAVTRDNARTLAFYVDGEMRASCEGTGIPSSNNFQDLSIGSTFGTIGPPPGGVEPPVWFFPGLIDQPAMWNLALTDAQITGVFSSGVDPLSSGLVGYWTFNEGTGQVVADLSPAANDGFLGELPEPDSADPLWAEVGEADAGEADAGDGTPTVLVANFMNGNTDTFNSRVYLWNPSTSPGNVSVRVFTLPHPGGLAQELTSSALNLGSLGARSALNLKLAEDILTPLGITLPYTDNDGDLTLEFTITGATARGATQVFSSSLAFGTNPLQEIPSTSSGSPTVLVANFMNGNTDAFNSRVYLWNPSTSPGNVSVRVFTLPLTDGQAQELTGTPLDLGILGARSALNLKLAEDILTPLGITPPYTTDGGNLTLEFTIEAAGVQGAAQVFSESFAFGTNPLQEIPPASSGTPTVLVASFMNGNDDAFNSRVYLWNPSESAGEVTVRVFTLPVSRNTARELTEIPLNLGTLEARSALNVKLAENILAPLGFTTPYVDDGGNLTLEFTIQAEKVRGSAQVFSSDFAFGTNPLVPIDSPVQTLPIPSLYGGEMQGEIKTFDLLMQDGNTEFIAGLLTPTSGYNGDYLGPTLLMRKGDQVVLNVTNQLGERTSTHWHGLHVPAVMDGGPHQMIEPGETWTASFPVLNRAATYWYHPHLHPSPGQGAIFEPTGTGYQVYRGLAGMIIIEDGTSDTLALPRSYGRDDIPLILQDRRFHEDGSLMHFPTDFNPTRDPALRKGGHFLVNGVEGPILEVGAQVVRLRILNASNARIYNLGFSDDRTFYQVVSDGGFLPAPVPMSRLVLAPAERAEILLDLGADEGRSLTLRSFNSENGTMFVPPPLQDAWDTADFDLLEIRIGSATADAVLTLPEALATVTRIPEFDAVNAESPRPFELNANPFGINGKRMDMAIIDEQIRLGDTEIWEITNPNSQAHPFHVHGDSFQILSRDGSPPPAHELGWKDVVLVRPFETVRIIKRFHDYADPVNPYMFHCHILEHEDVGMMGQFVVVDSEAAAVE
ncbi:MAG: multicopper oxidase domain-containing protein [Acidobacteria bacterium]|nr:multicopper oxidase domain-containing protein [Acidobacteriota bacterium]